MATHAFRFGAAAVFIAKRFTADAYFVARHRNQHPRDNALHVAGSHEPGSAITLTLDIGPNLAGSSVEDFLIALDSRISALERRFTADAVIV